MPNKLSGTAIQSGTITSAQLSETLTTTIESGGGPKITSITYPGDDLAANTGGGDSIVIRGSGFGANVQVYINNIAVSSLVRNNTNAVTITTAAQPAGTYPIYLINTDDGGTAILVPGIQYSGTPTWVSTSPLAEQTSDTWNISLSATGDSPIVYSLQEGSSLPDGITLATNGLISGTMTSAPAESTTYNFTVVATDPELQDTPKAFSVTVTIADPYFYLTTLLLSGDGANNQTNHTFLDSSNNNFTITRNGNASQGTFSPFSQTGWSNYFDGSGDNLVTPANTAFTFGTGDLTLECWIYQTVTSTSAYKVIFADNIYGLAGGWTLYSYNNALNLWKGGASVATEVIAPAGTIHLNSWNHVAWTRSGSSNRLYINGTQVGNTTTDSTNYTANAVYIGSSKLNDLNFPGYISDARVLKGTALYTSNFTPPTTPLTNIANTSLLTCQSNRFIDNSTNNFTITRNGDVSVQAFSPFAPSDKYSTANVGGSGYFDGTGDSLTIPDNSELKMGTGNFTIEAWVYLSSTTRDQYIISRGTSGTNGYVLWSPSGGTLRFTYGASTSITTTTTISSNVWTHVAVVREGTGTNQFKLYINGVASATSTVTTNFNDTNTQRIGESRTGAGVSPFLGFISSLRIVKGDAVYTANFTPPTAPLTNIANTSLLTNFTNAGIADATAKNVLETVGDAKISTDQSKFGGSSMFFDGTGDYLVGASNALFQFNTGDFTVECWVYSQSSSGYQTFFSTRSSNTGENANSFFLGFNLNTRTPIVFGSSLILASSTGLSGSTWTHVAATRENGTLRIFVNGTQTGTTTYTTNLTGSTPAVGATSRPEHPFTGYIDDLRVTKGYARYTSSFTPPINALQLR
jgi:hypothetical protein